MRGLVLTGMALLSCASAWSSSEVCSRVYRELTDRTLLDIQRGQEFDNKLMELAAKAKAGDLEAQEELTENLIAVMFPAILYGAKQADIQDKNMLLDALHDALIEAPRLLEKELDSPGAYLHGYARRKVQTNVRDWYRMRRDSGRVFNFTDVKEKDNSPELKDVVFRYGGFPTKAEPWMKLVAGEFEQILQKELSKFPERDQKIFRLRYRGKSVKEVADELDLSTYQVRESYQRLIGHLQEHSMEFEEVANALQFFPGAIGSETQ